MRALALLVSLTLAFPVTAQVFESSAGPIRVTQVAEGLDHPWGLAFLPDGRFLVTERDGLLKLVAADGTATEVAGVPEVAARGQGGLLDVALAHDFAESGRIYLSYSRPEPSGRARTAVAAATLDLAGPALSGVTDIFRMEPATRGGRHFGSRIVVTPEGNLFVTLGDRGERDMAQDTNTHQGTLIHILPDGTPAPGNPFLSGGGLPEIFSWGHRNAQGAALDPATGTLWTVEHGARGGDEINRP
ncbi:MAG: PQQ-dependent sugar dehydrogenase, partial [Pseudomonadota bacterium]